jgi:nucleolar protein 9
MRSKKSAAWKARQGPLKSVFNESDSREDLGSNNPPEIFSNAARKFVEVVRQELDGNETRALAADKVASPTLQVSNLSDLYLRNPLNKYFRYYSQSRLINR